MDNNEKNMLENDNTFEENIDNMTREINLDDLYDGAINNTVQLDAVNKNEIFIENKKSSYAIFGIIFAILVLLSLYYLYNKTNLGGTVKNVAPITTTTTKKEIVEEEQEKQTLSGTLSCSYTVKSDNESQVVSYNANFADDKIENSMFNYVVIANTEVTETSVTQTLINEYENFYIANTDILSNNLIFEKNDQGFTFNLSLDYKNIDVDSLMFTENETIFLVKPTSLDTYDVVKLSYEASGYTCSIITEE